MKIIRNIGNSMSKSHIDNGLGSPLCGLRISKNKKEFKQGEPTCKHCSSLTTPIIMKHKDLGIEYYIVICLEKRGNKYHYFYKIKRIWAEKPVELTKKGPFSTLLSAKRDAKIYFTRKIFRKDYISLQNSISEQINKNLYYEEIYWPERGKVYPEDMPKCPHGVNTPYICNICEPEKFQLLAFT